MSTMTTDDEKPHPISVALCERGYSDEDRAALSKAIARLFWLAVHAHCPAEHCSFRRPLRCSESDKRVRP